MPNNAVIYARYSSDKQTVESIDAQIRACKEYADKHDYTIVGVYADEAISGKGTNTNILFVLKSAVLPLSTWKM